MDAEAALGVAVSVEAAAQDELPALLTEATAARAEAAAAAVFALAQAAMAAVPSSAGDEDACGSANGLHTQPRS